MTENKERLEEIKLEQGKSAVKSEKNLRGNLR